MSDRALIVVARRVNRLLTRAVLYRSHNRLLTRAVLFRSKTACSLARYCSGARPLAHSRGASRSYNEKHAHHHHHLRAGRGYCPSAKHQSQSHWRERQSEHRHDSLSYFWPDNRRFTTGGSDLVWGVDSRRARPRSEMRSGDDLRIIARAVQPVPVERESGLYRRDVHSTISRPEGIPGGG